MGWRRSINVASGSLLAFAVLSGPAQAIEAQWELREQKDDFDQAYAVYEGAIAGSSYPAYRVETTFNEPIETSIEAAMRLLVTPSRAPENQRRTLLSHEGGAYFVHTVIEVPFFSDRDVTVRVEKVESPGSDAVELRWRAVPDHGPPAQVETVRITRSEGSWTFSPLEAGRTRAVYENHTDVGGRLPSWMVGSMLREEAVAQIGTLRESLRDLDLQDRRVDVAGAPPSNNAEKSR